MRLEPQKVKYELNQQIAEISRPKFLQEYVYGLLPEFAKIATPAPGDDINLSTVQNDGTGAATVEYRVGESTRLFAKLYVDDSGAHAYNVLRQLWEDGFNQGQQYQVPEPLCFLPECNLMLLREARGECLASYLNQDISRAIDGMKKAARWLLSLHGFAGRVGTVDQPWYVFLKLADRLSKTAASHPEELKRLLTMLDKLRELADRLDGREMVQIHGQFRPIHVFLHDDTVTVIDLDRSHPADPAIDVAEFIHRLRSTIHREDGPTGRANELTKTFLNEYLVQSPYQLEGLPFYGGFHVLVSLCRHIKRMQTDDPKWEQVINFYSNEFELAISNDYFGLSKLM